MTAARPPTPETLPERVALFVTCVVDQLWPEVAEATVRVLGRAGVAVEVPLTQTCCGQVAVNSGFRAEARRAAEHFVRCFEEYDAVVTPSGSCAAMIRGQLVTQLAGTADEGLLESARALSLRTWELSEFLTEVIEVPLLPQGFEGKVAVHRSCHQLRELGGGGTEELLSGIGGLSMCSHARAEECCGFGGLFSLRLPEVSGAMLESKCQALEDSSAEVIVSADASCLLHIGGGLRRRGGAEAPEVLHLAQVLDRAGAESEPQ